MTYCGSMTALQPAGLCSETEVKFVHCADSKRTMTCSRVQQINVCTVTADRTPFNHLNDFLQLGCSCRQLAADQAGLSLRQASLQTPLPQSSTPGSAGTLPYL